MDVEHVDMYSDSSGSLTKGGFGVYYWTESTTGRWDKQFMRTKKPSTEYLELFCLTVGAVLWIHNFRNRTIWLFCDNTSVRDVVNDTTSSCKNCMVLLRIIVLYGLKYNVRIRVKYVSSEENNNVDALSRSQRSKFNRITKWGMNRCATPIPEFLWPQDKIWRN